MAEGQVTIDGETRILEVPFFVIATQNPVETIGCFPLPEAQMDRFLMKISMGSLKAKEERELIDRYINSEPLQTIESVCSLNEIKDLQTRCRQVYVHEDLRDYIVNLVQATRRTTTTNIGSIRVLEGVSPRGTLALLRASQGYAMVQGRDYVVPEDIKKVAVPVLNHRLLSVDSSEQQKSSLINGLLQSISLPTEDWTRI